MFHCSYAQLTQKLLERFSNRYIEHAESEDTQERQAYIDAKVKVADDYSKVFELAKEVVTRSYPKEDVETCKTLKQKYGQPLDVVEKDKLEEGVTVKVLLSLEAIGEEDICTQVLKLSEDTWKVPVHEVFEVLVVIDVLSINSEKVTEMAESANTDVSEPAGEVEETVGGVLSSLKA